MRSRNLFLVSLGVFVALLTGYGLKRWTLGVDFTDEGAYVSWPLRTFFGEKPFVSELGTLLRPLVGYLSFVFRLHPGLTLYEFRLLGWGVHLSAFVVLSVYLFRLSRAAFQSPLIACVPFFVCHIFGLASPSYNTLSSDFFLLALSLRGLASIEGAGGKIPLNLASGLALFLATLAHPALGVVAAAMLAWEFLRHHLAANLISRRLTPSNLGVLGFVACWAAFLAWLIASGAAAVWLQRITLFQSLTVTAVNTHPVRFLLLLACSPFAFSLAALLFSLAALTTLAVAFFFARTKRHVATGAAHIFGLLLIIEIIYTFSHAPELLPLCLAQAGLFLVAAHGLGLTARVVPAAPPIRFLLAMSALGAVLYATVTFYFSPLRSWTSGILALPFPFAVGLTLLFSTPLDRSAKLFRTLTVASLVLAVACVAREHYRSIYRDSPIEALRATFSAPKFRHIHSTPERTQATDALYDYLHPRLTRGEPLLAFDDCPMLYYLFDAMPAYGLTWAVRYTQSPAALVELNRELNAKPLPRYAIRTLVDLSLPVWSTAPRTNYDNYPLNETLLAHYTLARTIFPFEIWELNSRAALEKASPGNPPP